MCSVGIVAVKNGVIVDNFYSLIKPRPNYYADFCQEVHGLDYEDTDNAPEFPEVWKQVEAFIARNIIAGYCGYNLKNHHHALADAEACAVIGIKIL